MSLPLPWPLLRLASPLLNRVLLSEPRVVAALQPLVGQVVRIESTSPDLRIHLIFNDDGIEAVEGEIEADLTLRGPLGKLLRLRDDPAGLRSREISLQGDTATGRALQDFVDALPDGIEELIAPLAGDTLAFRLGQIESMMRGFASRQGERIGEDTRAWLQDERDWLVNRDETVAYMDEVDQLDEAVNRLQQRIDRLS